MANKNLFSSKQSSFVLGEKPDTVNEAGGKAFKLSDKAALVKFALTGTLGNAFYTTAQQQLDETLSLADKVSDKFLAQTAVYARECGFMKDMPALLLAKLASRNVEILNKVFNRVCNNGKMIRNFVQIIRSGKAGRRSLGTAPKRMIQQWLNRLSDKALLNASVGASPSLADVIRLSHPKPANDIRKAFYGYLIDKGIDNKMLPEIVQEFERWKKNGKGDVPEVDFRLLTSSQLTPKQWVQIAQNANWQTTRQGLNMFERHGVFSNSSLVETVASKLEDRSQILKANVMPYQLMATYLNTETLDSRLRLAVQNALEISTENVPVIDGKIYVFPDVSGSMSSPATGFRQTATTKVRCIDIAALVSACILRKNPETEIIPFDTKVHSTRAINPKDSIATNSKKLSCFGGGGTDCSKPLSYLNEKMATGDLLIYVSDNQSWVDNYLYGSTGAAGEWAVFARRNPNAKLVNIDIQPYETTQLIDKKNVLNVSGFSDQVFDVINAFNKGELDGEHLVQEVEKVVL